ncbi:MAG TPA: hypothetical protein VGO50_19190 [Pyrinomonadaceae bacterium]|jgi:hypothetical protein|nr:hypothetical protein [Pyrinomonadaceae bacterium]
MLTDTTFGLVVFVSTYIIGRIINEGALRKLSVEQKAALVDAFSSYRIYSLIGVAVIFVGYILSVYFISRYDYFVNTIFFALIICVMLYNTFFAYKTLYTLGLPPGYMKSFWLSSIIQYVGVLILFMSVLGKYFGL